MFLITGCQRSGTTLLGIVCDAHPDVNVIDEGDNRFHVKSGETLVLDFQECLKHANKNNKLTGFKAPRDTHLIASYVASAPNMKILWMARSVFQVVASMMTLKMGQGLWAEIFAPREIRKYLTQFQDAEFEDQFKQAQKITDRRHRNIAMATLCWRAKNIQHESYNKMFPNSIHSISYDELVTRPDQTLRSVTDFLDLSWNAAVLDHRAFVKQEIHTGNTSSNRQIDTDSLMKWQSVLTVADINLIQTLSGNNLEVHPSELVSKEGQ